MISIVMATFRHANYIGQTISSILTQSLSDFELIIVVPYEDKPSIQVIDSWSKQDARIKVLFSKYANHFHQRNIGLYAAKGEYAMCFDSDDFMLPGTLKALLTTASLNKAVLVYPDFFLGDSDLQITSLVNVDEYNKELLKSRCYITDLSFVERSILMRHLPMRPVDAREAIWNLWIRISEDPLSIGRIIHHRRPTFIYRQHATSDHTTNTWKRKPPVRIGSAPHHALHEIPEISPDAIGQDHLTIYVCEPEKFFACPEKFQFKRTILHWASIPSLDLTAFPWITNISSDPNIPGCLFLKTADEIKHFLFEDRYT